jgi:hypothetical protein
MKHVRRISSTRPAPAQDFNFDNLNWTSFISCLVAGKNPLQCFINLFSGLL